MNIALIGCLGLLAMSSACLAMDDEPRAGRSMLVETDQEVLEAYWQRWRTAVAGPSGARWRWNLDQVGGLWSQGDEHEGDLETRVERYQQRLDEHWEQFDVAVVQVAKAQASGEKEYSSYHFDLWFSRSVIEQLDPDKNRVFDIVVDFRNGRELITVMDIQIAGDQITMVFPDGKGKIVARENEKRELVGLWTTDGAMEKPQELEFIGYPWYNRFCGNNGVWLSQEMIEILNGSWEMEFENLGSASCEFEVLSLDADMYKEFIVEGMRFGMPQEYSYVIANITTDQGEMNNLIGSVRPFRRQSIQHGFKMSLNYFDGEHAVHMTAELNNDGSLVGTMSSSKFGEDTWIAHQGVSKTRREENKP